MLVEQHGDHRVEADGIGLGWQSSRGERFLQGIHGEFAVLVVIVGRPDPLDDAGDAIRSRYRHLASHDPLPIRVRVIFPCSPIRSEGLPATALSLRVLGGHGAWF
ncbi:MAG: hypothetical protein WBV80_12225 [Mycobacterium sp.]